MADPDVLEELRLARGRIDLLTRELEDARAEAASLRDVVAELEEARDALSRRNRELERRLCGGPADPPAPAPRPGKGGYLSASSVKAIREAMDMKIDKVEHFRRAGATGGMDPRSADDIVSFLKTDIAVCDALLDIDFSSTESVVVGFGRIEGIMRNSLSPTDQAAYVLSLDDEEAEIEFRFSQVLGGVQEMMAAFDRSGGGPYD